MKVGKLSRRLFFAVLVVLCAVGYPQAIKREPYEYTLSSDKSVVQLLKKTLPGVIAINKKNETLEDFSLKLSKSYEKGLSFSLLFCDAEQLEDDTIYPVIISSLCKKLENVEENKWVFVAVPLYESPELSEFDLRKDVNIFHKKTLLGMKGYIMDKLKINEENKISELEEFDSFEAAGKIALSSLPDIIDVIAEDAVPAFITNTLQLTTVNEHLWDGRVVKRLTYPVVFFSDEKMKSPPQILKSAAIMFAGLIKISFVPNASPKIFEAMSLPTTIAGTNSLLMFDITDGQIRTFLYDRNMFGKYTTISLFGFIANTIQAQYVGQKSDNPFIIWNNVRNNHFRLPVDINFDEKITPESESETEEDFSNSKKVAFEKRDLNDQISTTDFKKLCVGHHDYDVVSGKLCIIGLFDRFSDQIDQQIGVLNNIQDDVFELESLLGKDRMLHFSFNFVWMDSVCNKQIVSRLGADPAAIPSFVAIYKTERGQIFSDTFKAAFDDTNGVSFVKDALRYRKLLNMPAGEKFDKYSARLQLLSADSNALADFQELELRAECEEGGSVIEEEDDLDDMLKEIREEERREAARLKEELKKAEEARKANEKPKKKKKSKKKKAKTEL